MNFAYKKKLCTKYTVFVFVRRKNHLDRDDVPAPGAWRDPYLYQHQSTGWCLYTWSVNRSLPVSTSKYWMMLVHLECEQILTCINIKVLDDACTPGVWRDPYLYQHQSTGWCLYTWSVNRSLPVSTSKYWMMLVHLECEQSLHVSTSKYWMMLVHLECEQILTCINIKVLDDACTPGVWTDPYLYQHQSTGWCWYTWSVNRSLPVSTSKYWMMLVHLGCEEILTCINIKVLDDACTPGVWAESSCINIKVLDDACTPWVWADPYLYQHQSTGWCWYTWSVNRSLPVSTSKYWMMLVHLECELTLTCINIKVLNDACTPGVWADPYLYQHQSTGWCSYTWSVSRSLPVSTSKYWMMLIHLECEQILTCINIKVLDDACTPGVWTDPYLYQHQSTGWCLYTWSVNRSLPVSTSKYWMMLVHLECEQILTCINIKVLDDARTLGVSPRQSRAT